MHTISCARNEGARARPYPRRKGSVFAPGLTAALYTERPEQRGTPGTRVHAFAVLAVRFSREESRLGIGLVRVAVRDEKIELSFSHLSCSAWLVDRESARAKRVHGAGEFGEDRVRYDRFTVGVPRRC